MDPNHDSTRHATVARRKGTALQPRLLCGALFLAGLGSLGAAPASAAITCEREVTANVVAIDQPILYNRLGASNVNGMMFALERDVVQKGTLKPKSQGGQLAHGNVQLRPDKRPRPLVLRVRVGDCLTVNFTNLLAAGPNPHNLQPPQFNVFVDEQVAERRASFHAAGMQLRDNIGSDGSHVGKNASSLAAPGQTRTYKLYAEKEGVFLVKDGATHFGSDANQGNSSNGLFGQVIVEPKGARIYRNVLTEEEMRLAADANYNGVIDAAEKTATGHPKIRYDATYPNSGVWAAEGKGGLPILNMMNPPTAGATSVEIVHSEIDAVIAGPLDNGHFPTDTYPLEKAGMRNPSLPNRLEPFRDYAQVWHDEPGTAQAFPGFYKNDPVFSYVLAGVKDGFMINYGSGGIGTEILANRLLVGPMHDCATCAYEEFFLTSFTVGDPAALVDVPANTGIEAVTPADIPAIKAGTSPLVQFLGPKATMIPYPGDNANVNHSYVGDFTKFRNTHVGKEQHVFHLHNHQWLYNPNDDNSNYLDAQGIGPGIGYTYEINFGGSGNRNKSAGDAIYHCHFYPHFAQGMWYMWRIHDVFENGTQLAVSGAGYHTTPWALYDGTPAAGARALPDGEVVAGMAIPAVVPLPGKPLAPVPGASATIKPNPLTTTASMAHPTAPGATVPVGSLASVARPVNGNPGYPFWIAGIEDLVGQRPPTPPLDMADAATVAAAKALDPDLFANLEAAQAAGFDGGLPRGALQGYAAGGVAISTESAIDFSKVVEKAKPVYYPEYGTDLEHAAMRYHAQLEHATSVLGFDGSVLSTTRPFITNGLKPAIGGVYHDPCRDDMGRPMDGRLGEFYSGEGNTDPNSPDYWAPMGTRGMSPYTGKNPRIYKGANIQFDAILNKAGYHYPQQRIIALWEDAVPVITKQQPPEPLVMRLNTFDCAIYHHTNLVPEVYEMDDYQVRTPTDIIGQHIHLPKWDLTTTDGAANGWNYEDGTLSPGAVRERIHAVNEWNIEQVCDNHAPVAPAGTPLENHVCPAGTAKAGQQVAVPTLHAKPHPYFDGVAPATLKPLWVGARTTIQRWFVDPVVNTKGVDRGLGIIFTHDHYGPSTHQQVGLYATVLVQPAGSTWVHNETGEGMYTRADGGPTSWQAAILPNTDGRYQQNVKAETQPAFREFYFEYSDFQHAYEKGVYVGAGELGEPLGHTEPGVPTPGFLQVLPGAPEGGPAGIQDAFRFAINPPAREQATPLFPNLVNEVASGVLLRCPTRPCPQAIDVEDPGMMSVNYRNEPVALRIYDPNKVGPDGKRGAQANGVAGDLAFALSTYLTDKTGAVTPITRAIPEMNKTEAQLGFWAKTLNAPGAQLPGDPFTPMMRAYAGDLVRMKIQAGGHEEEHNVSVHGLKWLQAGSGFGRAPNSGWRNAYPAGISEQFTFLMPELTAPKAIKSTAGAKDYAYSVDTSMDGWWTGMWGVLRAYDNAQGNLIALPNNPDPKPANIVNRRDFDGVCPTSAPVKNFTVLAILANDLLPNPGVSITYGDGTMHVGGSLDPNGGTLVYNPRTSVVRGVDENGAFNGVDHAGPIHDPTAMMYVDLRDVEAVNAKDPACSVRGGRNAGTPTLENPACKIKLKDGRKVEPLIMRVNAGDCLKVTLHNRLPAVAPDLPTLATLIGVVKRERFGAEGSIPFDNNLIRPSSHVGLHSQLLAVDVTQDDGTNVGINITQTTGPVLPDGKLDKAVTYTWYAGDLSAVHEGSGVRLVATPVEFGGAGLMPADKVKQGQKSLVGGMVVHAPGATVVEDAGTRAQATVTNANGLRSFMLVMTKDLNHRYADGAPVEHMNGEGAGIPEDSQENSGMALNYGIEPMWFRFGIAPSAPFGGAGCGPGCYGGVPNQGDAYANSLVGGDPATPVFKATAGKEARMHVAVPHSTSRGTTMAIHGHVWQRDPYVCSDNEHNMAGRCETAANGGLLGASGNPMVGSQRIGNNPMGFAQGGQESLTAYTHFDFVLPSAGGGNAVAGDYLFRDQGSFGNASGLWGILRVE